MVVSTRSYVSTSKGTARRRSPMRKPTCITKAAAALAALWVFVVGGGHAGGGLGPLVASASAAMTDPATGIAFAPKVGGLEVFGVGVRRKGPIKVYSVAMYCTSALKDKLAGFSKSDPQAVRCLREDVAGGAATATADANADANANANANAAVFDLQMSFKVSGEKMASAIAESVLPRYAGPKDEVDRLKSMIAAGVGDQGATKGTRFRFECSDSGISVSVNGKGTGTVPSHPLARAFCDVYLDDKCVSPALRASILENCCAP